MSTVLGVLVDEVVSDLEIVSDFELELLHSVDESVFLLQRRLLLLLDLAQKDRHRAKLARQLGVLLEQLLRG